MRFSLSLSTALVALLARSVAGLGLRSNLARKLQLSAELGLDPKHFLDRHQSFHAASAKTSSSDISPDYVSLPIDHDDPSVGTYKNRYWVNDDYFEPGGPVILYDAGELNAEGSVSHLRSDLTFLSRLLDEFKAIGVIWEHRYYGESLPYPVSNQTPPEHFKYLTTAQALADIPVFAENFSRPAFEDLDLTPKSTPWVMVGGSYAGIRAALARQEYPDTIFAALASSAPVQARINMSSYNDQVYRGMVRNGAGNCSKDIHAAFEYIDDQLSHERTAASIKQLFFGVGAEKNSNEGFTAALGAIFGFYQTYGMGGPAGSLGDFCNYLERDPVTNTTVGSEGLAPHRGNKYVAERWAKWPPFTELVNLNMDTNCRGLDNSTAPSCKLNSLTTDADSIAWAWQYCTEWGFYQINNVGAQSILSRFQTLESQQEICNRQFPDAVKSGLLPSEPQANTLNEVFGGWTIRPSNVFFTEGEFDPWRTLSLLSTEEFSPRFNVTSDIPKCGVQTDAGTVFGHVGPNAFHCFDLDLFNDGAKESLGYFRQALKEWLPCFEEQKHD